MEDCGKEIPCSVCDQKDTCDTRRKMAHEERILNEKMKKIKYKIMVMSGKGGVGKSTVAANLAVRFALDGYKVGLLDADIHGPNIPKMLGMNQSQILAAADGHSMLPPEAVPGLKVLSMGMLLGDQDVPVVWRGPLKHSAIKQFLAEADWGELEFLLVDLPPGTGDEPLSVAQVIKGKAGAIIVTTPQEVALLDSRKAVTFSRMLKTPVLGIIENMSGFICPHCGKSVDIFKVGGGEKAARELNVDFLGRIPLDPRIVETCDNGKPFILSSNTSEAARRFDEIAKKVAGLVKDIEEKV